MTIVHHEFLFCLLFALEESSLRFPLQTYLAVASDIAATIQSRSVAFGFPITSSLSSVKPEAVALQAQFKPLFPNLRKGAHPSFFFLLPYPLHLAFVLLLSQGTSSFKLRLALILILSRFSFIPAETLSIHSVKHNVGRRQARRHPSGGARAGNRDYGQ